MNNAALDGRRRRLRAILHAQLTQYAPVSYTHLVRFGAAEVTWDMLQLVQVKGFWSLGAIGE